MTFGDRVIINDFSTKILRGDKIGLIGTNGIGKTTLLKTILGEITPVSGKVKLGSKLEVAYFDQLRQQLDDDKTIQEVIRQGRIIFSLMVRGSILQLIWKNFYLIRHVSFSSWFVIRW